MRPIYDKLIKILIAELAKMPTIGTRTAERLAYFILHRTKENNEKLCQAIRDVSEKVVRCEACNNFTEHSPCEICRDDKRIRNVVCVVEEPHDLVAVEKTGKYNGLYHVLLGVLSPLEGVGPEDLEIQKLVKRVESGEISEVILATNTTSEGETTALYLVNLIRKINSKVTLSRIAYGLAVGADLEYIDASTIAKSLEGRNLYKS